MNNICRLLIIACIISINVIIIDNLFDAEADFPRVNADTNPGYQVEV